jgi:hypothetical protein
MRENIPHPALLLAGADGRTEARKNGITTVALLLALP